MPLYAIKCPACAREGEVFRSLAAYNDLPTCVCGAAMERKVSAPMLSVAFEPYISPASGNLISSRNEQREDLTRTGHFLQEPGVEKDVARNRERVMEKAFEPVAAAIDQKVTQLVSQGQIAS